MVDYMKINFDVWHIMPSEICRSLNAVPVAAAPQLEVVESCSITYKYSTKQSVVKKTHIV